MDTLLKNKAASGQLKRDNALLFAEVNNLQLREKTLVKQLASVNDAHARTKEDLCNATGTISELKTSEAKAREIYATSELRMLRLMLEKQALQTRLDTPPPPPAIGVPYQICSIQNQPLSIQTTWVSDDSDIYD